MESEDGQIFVKNLATFVRTHERNLANALHLQRQRGKNGIPQNTASAASSTSPVPGLSRSYLTFSPAPTNIKPAKLSLTPHHLFYLLSKFEDLAVDVGPMNVRLENLQLGGGHSNYVSFLGRAPKSKGKQADTESLRSVSSMRSVVSSMSNLWSNLTLAHATAKAEKREAQYREDIRYLYSCFTKIPALKLSPDPRARLVAGFEEFPFDTAVPLFAFKNVSALEICDLDFRQFHGWDRLSEQLRSLTVRRANVDDPIDLLQHIVLDDFEKRRRRSFKTPVPTTPSTPGGPWSTSSPKGRQLELGRTISAPSPQLGDHRRSSIIYGSPYGTSLQRDLPTEARPAGAQSQLSTSPARPISSRQGSMAKPQRSHHRRSSGSSGSSGPDVTPRHSSTDLLTLNILPSSKWQFLRHLSLAENGLTWLHAASLAPVAPTLQSLDLSGNLFSEVPEALASLTNLRALNLSDCMIDSLKSLSRSPLPAITVLNLRSNRLLSLAGIERLFPLERIDLRDNKLHDPTELGRLTNMPDVVDIFVMKNPFTRTHGNYRVTIFNLFRSTPGRVTDVTIDGLLPTNGEKRSLADWAPEPANVPVIRPPLEDELRATVSTSSRRAVEVVTASSGAATEDELRVLNVGDQQPASSSSAPLPRAPGHRRVASDSGPSTMTRKKKRPPRRRIVELSQADESSSVPSLTTSATTIPVPIAEPRPRTPPSGSDHQPQTPVDTPLFQPPSTTAGHLDDFQSPSTPPDSRPTPLLAPAFTSPVAAAAVRKEEQSTTPRIRDSSDYDDDDPDVDPEFSSPHPHASNSFVPGEKLGSAASTVPPPPASLALFHHDAKSPVVIAEAAKDIEAPWLAVLDTSPVVTREEAQAVSLGDGQDSRSGSADGAVAAPALEPSHSIAATHSDRTTVPTSTNSVTPMNTTSPIATPAFRSQRAASRASTVRPEESGLGRSGVPVGGRTLG